MFIFLLYNGIFKHLLGELAWNLVHTLMVHLETTPNNSFQEDPSKCNESFILSGSFVTYDISMLTIGDNGILLKAMTVCKRFNFAKATENMAFSGR